MPSTVNPEDAKIQACPLLFQEEVLVQFLFEDEASIRPLERDDSREPWARCFSRGSIRPLPASHPLVDEACCRSAPPYVMEVDLNG